MVTILLTAVVPKIIEQFDHLGHALPASTRMLIAMSDTLQTSGVYWLGAGASGAGATATQKSCDAPALG